MDYKPSVLIVEDERIIAMDLKFKLSRLGFCVKAAVPSGEKALDFLSQSRPDLILMDIMLEGQLDGVETTQQISERHKGIPVIYITAFTDAATYDRAMATRPLAFLSKPVAMEDLQAAVKTALGRENGSNAVN
ncbi:MAG: response regulator [Desulfovibrionaceae bacterium]|nr:response regulator [Desulfovibrionaceae bacterium]MBF0513206.1 response regulator [Desulfovibrionaceae bacterium]